jgi:hypothetical protein
MSDTGLGIDFSFALSAQLGELHNAIRQDRLDRIRAAKENTPKPFRQQNAAFIPTPTAPTGIGLGGPSNGYMYELRSITIGGLTFTTAAPGTAEVYSSAQGSGLVATTRDLTEIVDQATALPIVGGYSTGQVILQFPEKLSVVIVGGTAGQQYTAVAFWREYRTIPYVSEVDQ